MHPKLCPQFSRAAIVSSITPGTGRRYNGSGFFFLSGKFLVWLLCRSSNHGLTRPPNKHNPTFSIFFIRQRLQRAFATTALTSASRPNFSIKAVTGIKEVWPHLHSKLMWLFVMVASLSKIPSTFKRILVTDKQQQRPQLQLQQQAPPLAPQQRLICNQSS